MKKFLARLKFVFFPKVAEMGYAEVDAMYAKLPELDCKGLCQECCGPIMMSRIEWVRIQESTGMPLEHFQKQAGETFVCPLLSPAGKCTVYEIRPLVCRLWGSTPKAKCPFGCQPKRWVEESEVVALLSEADKISARRGL